MRHTSTRAGCAQHASPGAGLVLLGVGRTLDVVGRTLDVVGRTLDVVGRTLDLVGQAQQSFYSAVQFTTGCEIFTSHLAHFKFELHMRSL